MRIIILPILLLLTACSAVIRPGKEPISPASRKTDQQRLQGGWELVRDDEFPDGNFSEEIIYFHKDGQLRVDGPVFLCGRYAVSGDQLQIIAPVKGHEIAYYRKFILDQNGLHLKNIRKGFAHYKKRKGLLRLCIPDEQWQIRKIGFFSFKAPVEWQVQGGEPNSNGIQELRLMNPDESKLLLAVRLPVARQYPQQEVVKITRQIAARLLQDTPMAGFQIRRTAESHLHGIHGAVFSAKTSHPPLNLKVVIRRMPYVTAIIYTLYSFDQLKELEHMAELIYVDGAPLSSR